MQAAKQTILVADDTEDMRSALESLLGGYRVVTAMDGEQALLLAEKEMPQLAMLDVNMPGLNGLQVLERLSRLKPRPMVIMLTAETELGTGVKAISLGAYAYLTKPFEAARVLETVEAALAEFARRNPRTDRPEPDRERTGGP